MFACSSRLSAAALGLALAAGCLYPVGEKVDRVVCDLAARPRDVAEVIPAEAPAAMPPAQGARPADPHVAPAGNLAAGSPGGGPQAGAGGTGGSGQAGAPPPSTGKTGVSG